jgi:hypothetical protein
MNISSELPVSGYPTAVCSAIGAQYNSSTEWRTVHGWPEYEVSETGHVRRTAPGRGVVAGRVLRPLRNRKTGYLSVCLSRHPIQVRVDIHRLVAIAFHGLPPSNNHLVAHNDGCRTNNHFRNLRWATQSENLLDRRRHGTAPLGVLNPSTHLDELDVKSMRRMKTLGIPRSVIAAGFGLHQRTVFKILSRASWGHVQ